VYKFVYVVEAGGGSRGGSGGSSSMHLRCNNFGPCLSRSSCGSRSRMLASTPAYVPLFASIAAPTSAPASFAATSSPASSAASSAAASSSVASSAPTSAPFSAFAISTSAVFLLFKVIFMVLRHCQHVLVYKCIVCACMTATIHTHTWKRR
jgi:hypothetical protein